MRIIAGRFRGRRLAHVGKGDPGAHLRPTTDRVRESLFSVLVHRGLIDEAVVLDLFAGTGALGLEALSRGAASVTFVERNRIGSRLVAENIRTLGVEDDTDLIVRDATRLGGHGARSHDLVFLDPPYGSDLGARALNSAVDAGWLSPQAAVVWEDVSARPPPPGFRLDDRRDYGGTQITLLRRDGTG